MPDPFDDPADFGSDPPWLGILRAAGTEAAAHLEAPSATEELWRYTDPKRIPLDGSVQPVTGSVPIEDAFGFVRDGLPHDRVVACSEAGDVVVRPGLDAHGARLGPLTGAPGGIGGSLVPVDRDLLTALNAAHLRGGVFVGVPAGVVVPAPIVVVHWLSDGDRAAFPRTLIVIEEGAEAEIVEVWASPDGIAGALVDAVCEIDVHDGAHLRYTGVQRIGDGSVFVGAQGARVGRDATLALGAVNLGAWLGRLRVEAELVGQGAEAELVGAYVGDGDRQVDFRTLQRHTAPRGRSNLVFKGAVAGRSAAIFSGLIRVEREAPKTDAHQSSRSVVLSPHAKAESIPNLEILNNEVTCGASFAGGPPDADQLFYLESRGIDPATAHRMVVDGFFDDIVERLPVDAVRPWVRAEIMRRIVASRDEQTGDEGEGG